MPDDLKETEHVPRDEMIEPFISDTMPVKMPVDSRQVKNTEDSLSVESTGDIRSVEGTGNLRSVEESEEPHLVMEPEGLTLVSGGLSIRGDFTRMQKRIRPDSLSRELLVRAARIKDPEAGKNAVDATAGLGEDSFLLAAAGWNVWMCEFDSVIAELLNDAMKRAAEVPALAEIIARMKLLKGDSRELLPNLPFRPDIILLDPMFPERQKSSLVKKKAQLLQKLEKPCTDETGLLSAAMKASPRRIIIKRPIKGPYLAGVKPDYLISGKTVRYDCITTLNMK